MDDYVAGTRLQIMRSRHKHTHTRENHVARTACPQYLTVSHGITLDNTPQQYPSILGSTPDLALLYFLPWWKTMYGFSRKRGDPGQQRQENMLADMNQGEQ